MNIKMGVIVGSLEATIGNIMVVTGDIVKKNQALLQYEAKKGSFTLKAPVDGTILEILCESGDTIKKDDLLFNIEEKKEEKEVVSESTNIKQLFMSIIPGAKEALVGKIISNYGDIIKIDDELFHYETKKGTRAYKSTIAGKVSVKHVNEGQRIEKDTLLFDIIQQIEVKEDTIEEKFEEEQILETDLLIVGAGPGGYVAALHAAKSGKKVLLIEKEALGGTCLNVGCIPTKALVKSSEVHHSALHSEVFGIEIDKSAIKPNMNKIIDHKNNVVQQLVSGIEGLLKSNDITVIKGTGSFTKENNVVVVANGIKSIIHATDIIIATGSKISTVPIPGLDLPFVLNSTTALCCRELPKSIAIVGGGVIGMEFAFIYNNLGVEVTVIEYMDHLLAMLDIDESQEIKHLAIDKGIKIYNNSKVLEVSSDVQNKAIVSFEKRGTKRLLVVDKVLVAIGRQPNLEGLNLEATDIEMDPKRRGIKVDSTMKTSIDHIYAIGDVTNIIQLAHVASHQGIVAVDNICGIKTDMTYDAVPNVIFTSPEIATVGVTETYCKEQKISYNLSKFYYQGNGKAITMEETSGYIKLIENADSKLLIGAAIIGADASNLISTLTLAIQNKLTTAQIRSTIFPHPTTSEVIHEGALGLGLGYLHQ